MLAERWRLIETVFLEAAAKSAEARSSYLDEACSGDESMRREIDSLLEYEELARSFLESEASGAAPPADPGEPVPAGERIGPYTIGKPLGFGGMGEVYAARDQRLDRQVAIKFLSRRIAGDATSLIRFEREARAASALNHPNICILYDIGEHNGRPYLVMELLEGQLLKVRIAEGPVGAPELASIARQVCAALQATHEKGIVHRDIKPANIFLTQGKQVKVLDFGLAKTGPDLPAELPETALRTHNLSVAGAVMGTLPYMSPEQALGQDVDTRTDIFSLGVVLYEMATGRHLFRAKTPAGILASILTESPVRPSSINPSLPHKLDRVILKALEKEPANRYQSAADLSSDLTLWLASQDRKTRRWALAATGVGAAGLAAGAFLNRDSWFSSKGKIRMAVLPFENLGGNPAENSFTYGLHGETISALNRLFPEQLSVIDRDSVKRYKGTNAAPQQIARELIVDYIVEGGVRRTGDQVHITARLIRAQDQASLWSAAFDRDLEQLSTAQGEIAKAIARGIGHDLRPDERVASMISKPIDGAAHEAYLRGNYSRAVELDPGYAAAHAGVADKLYYAGLFEFLPPSEAFSKMANAATRALDLDPTQVVAHGAIALSRLHQQWNWRGAEESFVRALQLDPSNAEVRHWYSHFLLWAGRRSESVKECDRAIDISPFSATLLACRGWHALYAGDYDKTIEDGQLALTYDPNDKWAPLVMGWAYEQKGMLPEALASFRNAFDSGLKTTSIAHVFARMGNRPAAEKILTELLAAARSKYISPYGFAVIYLGLGDKERALAELSNACNEHSSFMLYASSDPRLRPLRRNPPFQDLLRRMGLPAVRA